MSEFQLILLVTDGGDRAQSERAQLAVTRAQPRRERETRSPSVEPK